MEELEAGVKIALFLYEMQNVDKRLIQEAKAQGEKEGLTGSKL